MIKKRPALWQRTDLFVEIVMFCKENDIHHTQILYTSIGTWSVCVQESLFSR